MKIIKIKNTDSLNLAIIINKNITDSNITTIINDIKKISNELSFVSMSRTKDTTNINLDIYLTHLTTLHTQDPQVSTSAFAPG